MRIFKTPIIVFMCAIEINLFFDYYHFIDKLIKHFNLSRYYTIIAKDLNLKLVYYKSLECFTDRKTLYVSSF